MLKYINLKVEKDLLSIKERKISDKKLLTNLFYYYCHYVVI